MKTYSETDFYRNYLTIYVEFIKSLQWFEFPASAQIYVDTDFEYINENALESNAAVNPTSSESPSVLKKYFRKKSKKYLNWSCENISIIPNVYSFLVKQ